jgi:hypothetical protein
MHTPSPTAGSPTAGSLPPPAGQPREPNWPRIILHAAPVVIITIYGALWITLHAGGGRSSAHTLWQSLALTETVIALLLRQRKPAGALAGVLAGYLAFDLDPLLLPAVLVALLTIAATRGRRTAAVAAAATATVIAAMPYLHGDPVSLPGYLVPRLTAAAIAAAAGTYLHERGKTTGLRARPGHPGGGPDPRGARTRPDIAGGPR